MTMEQINALRHLAWIGALLAAAIVLGGCGASRTESTGQKSAKEAAPEVASRGPEAQPRVEPEPEPEGKAEPGSGEPLPEPEPAVGPELGPELNSPTGQANPSVEPEPQAVVEPGPEVAPPPGEETQPGSEPATEPGPEPSGTEPEPATEPDRESAGSSASVDAPKMPELGPPLVKDPKGLVRLDKTRPVWLDKARKQVVMIGRICQREAPLELFACLRNTKEHEAIVSVDVKAQTVHAGLLAVGAKPGHPAQWDPKYAPATGTEIEVSVVWKDKQGKTKTARAQDWILDTRTNKAMTHPWVFAGSSFWIDETTGRKYYRAEGGDLVCVSNFASAMLDLPIESSQANEALLFRAFTERIPPLGTPVTLLLGPKVQKDEKKEKPKATEEAGEKPKPTEDTGAKRTEPG